MRKVYVGQSFTDFCTGKISIRVIGDGRTSVYKIKSADMRAIYDSIRREVLAEAQRRIMSDMPRHLNTVSKAITEVGETTAKAMREMHDQLWASSTDAD